MQIVHIASITSVLFISALIIIVLLLKLIIIMMLASAAGFSRRTYSI